MLRPADANEVVEAWRVIMNLHHEAVVLILTRQDVPTLDRSKYAPASGLAHGAYILADNSDGQPDVILIGTGSEVSLCVAAYEQLKSNGISPGCEHALVGIVRAAGASLSRPGAAAGGDGSRSD